MKALFLLVKRHLVITGGRFYSCNTILKFGMSKAPVLNMRMLCLVFEEECDRMLRVQSLIFQQSVLQNAEIKAEILSDFLATNHGAGYVR